MHYLWWIPSVIVWYAVYSWMSKQNNDLGGKWFWFMVLYGMTGILWVPVSRVSKDIVFDALLYDVIIALTFVSTLFYLGCGEKFAWPNWFGVAMVMIGFVLMKINFK